MKRNSDNSKQCASNTEAKGPLQPSTLTATSSQATQADGSEDIWDTFVRENWAPALESTFGHSWKNSYPEDVTAILWWALAFRNRPTRSDTQKDASFPSPANFNVTVCVDPPDLGENFDEVSGSTKQKESLSSGDISLLADELKHLGFGDWPMSTECAPAQNSIFGVGPSRPPSIFDLDKLPVVASQGAIQAKFFGMSGGESGDSDDADDKSVFKRKLKRTGTVRKSFDDSTPTETQKMDSYKIEDFPSGNLSTQSVFKLPSFGLSLGKRAASTVEPQSKECQSGIKNNPMPSSMSSGSSLGNFSPFKFPGLGPVASKTKKPSNKSKGSLFDLKFDEKAKSNAKSKKATTEKKSKGGIFGILKNIYDKRGCKSESESSDEDYTSPVETLGDEIEMATSPRLSYKNEEEDKILDSQEESQQKFLIYQMGDSNGNVKEDEHPQKKAQKYRDTDISGKIPNSSINHVVEPIEDPAKEGLSYWMPNTASTEKTIESLFLRTDPNKILKDMGLARSSEIALSDYGKMYDTCQMQRLYQTPVPSSLTSIGYPFSNQLHSPVKQPITATDFQALSNYVLQSVVDGMDSAGRCPIHIAAIAGRSDIISQLLHVNCDSSKVLPVDLLAQPNSSKSKRDGYPSWMTSLIDQQSAAISGFKETQRRHVYAKGYGSRKERKQAQIFNKLMEEEMGIKTPLKYKSGRGELGDSLRDLRYLDNRRHVTNKLNIENQSLMNSYIESDPCAKNLSLKFCNAIHLAAYYGHFNCIEMFLTKSRCDSKARNEFGCTPLHFAANRGYRRIVARLLAVPDMWIDIKDMHGRTALHHAAAQGRTEIIDELWPKGCKFDAVDVMGWTAMHYAAHAGHTEVVMKLIIAGCPISKLDCFGYAAAHIAARSGYESVIEKLMHAGYDVDAPGGISNFHGWGGSTALHIAASNGRVSVIKFLLQNNSNPEREDFRGYIPLQCAAEGGHLDAFTILLERTTKNAKIREFCSSSVLHSAASIGNWDIVRELLNLSYDHTRQVTFGRTALHQAAQGGSFQVAQNLLNLGCDISAKDSCGNMPWHVAVEGGNLKVLELFLSKGCNIEDRNDEGYTALHVAAKAGHKEAIMMLLDKGVDIRAVTDEAKSALHIAAEKNHVIVFKILIDHFYKHMMINARDRYGYTALHYVVERGNIELLKDLILHGAEVNVTTNDGLTPIHIATKNQSQSTVEALLACSCEPSHKDAIGLMPISIAAINGDANIFFLLFKYFDTSAKYSDQRGYTLLHHAIEGGNTNIIQTILLQRACEDCLSDSPIVPNALHLACKLGNTTVAQGLLDFGYSVRGKGPDKLEPIHFASIGYYPNSLMCQDPASSENSHLQVLNVLLKRGADPHVLDANGSNALNHAAACGNLEVVKKLLGLKLDICNTDVLGFTAMHAAALGGNAEVIIALIKAGVPVDGKDSKGKTPLFHAAESGHLQCVIALIEQMVAKKININEKDEKGFSPVIIAASKGHAEIVTKLLETDKSKDIKGTTAGHLAAQRKFPELLRLLLRSGKLEINSRDADGCTPLHYAAENGCDGTVSLLLSHNADLFITSSDGQMAIHKAASNNHVKIVKMLIEKGALDNCCTSNGSSPLHFASSSGSVDVIKYLIEAGCPIDQCSTSGIVCTPLFCAASNGHLEAVNILLTHEADMEIINGNESTPLHAAASNGHAKVVKRLIEAGADIDIMCANSTALHSATNNGHIEVVEVLIEADCDIDAQNSIGNTALHIAASKGSMELTKAILKSGCDIHLKNAKGHQPIHSAATSGFFEVVLLLVRHGAIWRQKGDLDVAKLLCRKSNLKASYVEGRLRLAEPKKHRKSKTNETIEAVHTEEEMKEMQAHADAMMAQLIAEEAEEKKKEAQKSSRKDKKKKTKVLQEKTPEESKDYQDGFYAEADAIEDPMALLYVEEKLSVLMISDMGCVAKESQNSKQGRKDSSSSSQSTIKAKATGKKATSIEIVYKAPAKSKKAEKPVKEKQKQQEKVVKEEVAIANEKRNGNVKTPEKEVEKAVSIPQIGEKKVEEAATGQQQPKGIQIIRQSSTVKSKSNSLGVSGNKGVSGRTEMDWAKVVRSMESKAIANASSSAEAVQFPNNNRQILDESKTSSTTLITKQSASLKQSGSLKNQEVVLEKITLAVSSTNSKTGHNAVVKDTSLEARQSSLESTENIVAPAAAKEQSKTYSAAVAALTETQMAPANPRQSATGRPAIQNQLPKVVVKDKINVQPVLKTDSSVSVRQKLTVKRQDPESKRPVTYLERAKGKIEIVNISSSQKSAFLPFAEAFSSTYKAEERGKTDVENIECVPESSKVIKNIEVCEKGDENTGPIDLEEMAKEKKSKIKSETIISEGSNSEIQVSVKSAMVYSSKGDVDGIKREKIKNEILEKDIIIVDEVVKEQKEDGYAEIKKDDWSKESLGETSSIEDSKEQKILVSEENVQITFGKMDAAFAREKLTGKKTPPPPISTLLEGLEESEGEQPEPEIKSEPVRKKRPGISGNKPTRRSMAFKANVSISSNTNLPLAATDWHMSMKMSQSYSHLDNSPLYFATPTFTSRSEVYHRLGDFKYPPPPPPPPPLLPHPQMMQPYPDMYHNPSIVAFPFPGRGEFMMHSVPFEYSGVRSQGPIPNNSYTQDARSLYQPLQNAPPPGFTYYRQLKSGEREGSPITYYDGRYMPSRMMATGRQAMLPPPPGFPQGSETAGPNMKPDTFLPPWLAQQESTDTIPNEFTYPSYFNRDSSPQEKSKKLNVAPIIPPDAPSWLRNAPRSVLSDSPSAFSIVDSQTDTDRMVNPIISQIPEDPWEIGEMNSPKSRVHQISSLDLDSNPHVICPLSKKVMEDPVVAADGFTYERSYIERWLLGNEESPVTKCKLPNKDLYPNLTMRAAIRLLGPFKN